MFQSAPRNLRSFILSLEEARVKVSVTGLVIAEHHRREPRFFGTRNTLMEQPNNYMIFTLNVKHAPNHKRRKPCRHEIRQGKGRKQ